MSVPFYDRLCRLAPPGTDLRREVWALLWGGGLSLGQAVFGFTRRFRTALQSHTLWYLRDHGSGEEVRLPDFSVLTQGLFVTFWAFLVLSLGLAALHYRSFYSESKSIYTMRRLPDPGEFHRRCLALPLGGAVIGFLLHMLSLWGMHLAYRLIPAEQYLGALEIRLSSIFF